LARHVTTRLVDDIDGSQAVTTVSFSLDGDSYEIDLSESHLSALRQALAPFVSAARTVTGGSRPARTPAPRPEPTEKVVEVREVIPTAAATDRTPFRQPSPQPPATQARRKPAPLVADPFNPQR
jgi:Lsr2